MLALLAVATLAAAPAPEVPARRAESITALPPQARARTCGLQHARPIHSDAPRGRFQSLGELPRANFELTLLRLDENGCSVAVGLRRNVEGDGHFPRPRR